MGSHARFEHYLATLEVETCPEFWLPSLVSGPLCSGRRRAPEGTAGRTHPLTPHTPPSFHNKRTPPSIPRTYRPGAPTAKAQPLIAANRIPTDLDLVMRRHMDADRQRRDPCSLETRVHCASKS